ncbi:hypothetical protein HER10_EVM0011092 [Colletotrichum scovillei]|uniref:uncharacterized protein n=1 Tax=Colletotrichum scovillei TaxID=1209932 RepID=UPI0015C2E3E5|nr:uncharacterized protein HER10_EVM0011092 [Colletotrichum scovillei]KAF4774276.1 hypothetical protein HER10_EVM0011092 [Colletotrichum scovillei]
MYIPEGRVDYFFAIHDVSISDSKLKAMEDMHGDPWDIFVFFGSIALGTNMLVAYLDARYNPPQYYYGDNLRTVPNLRSFRDQSEPLPRYEREDPTARPLLAFEGNTPPPAYGTVFHIPAPYEDEEGDEDDSAGSSRVAPDSSYIAYMV